MEVIFLDDNMLSGTLPVEWAAVQKMDFGVGEFSYGSSQGIVGTLPSAYGALSNLNELSLISTNLTGIVPESYKTLCAHCEIDLGDVYHHSLVTCPSWAGTCSQTFTCGRGI